MIGNCILQKELYVGSAPSATSSIEWLQQQGITAIMDLTEESDYYSPLPIIKTQFTHCNFPLQDLFHFPLRNSEGAPPSLNQLHEICTILKKWKQESKVIYVHCRSGCNRSPLIAMAYLVIVNGEKLNRAIAAVSIKHPTAKPNAYQLAALCEYVKLAFPPKGSRF